MYCFFIAKNVITFLKYITADRILQVFKKEINMAIFPTSTDSIRVKIRILIVLAFSLGIPLAMPPRAFGAQVDAIKMKSGH